MSDPANRAAERIATALFISDPGIEQALADTIRSEYGELMSCGHPKVCLAISAETDEPLFCRWCDAVSAARDAMTDKLPCGHEKACQFPDLKKCTACEREVSRLQSLKEKVCTACQHNVILAIEEVQHGQRTMEDGPRLRRHV